ncbi:hypothetical protein O6H91_17G005100 [Diphasiastrum complanatum]|uniref:Uncharacterized protein n=1 Tax=Diphasiastrum complanatum TaxID=34168 RepID=A0ACC2B3W9_DIPCM|nr:hypothetical protein O6H91_17G005100 [Diphasiastrum complanatum]
MSQEQPSQQDRGLFGLFGGKKDEHQQQHGTTGDNTTDQGHGSHVSTGTEYGTGAVDQGAGSHTGYGTGVGHVSHTPDTGYNAAAGEYTTGAPNATHPGGEEKKHGLLGKLHKSGSSSSSSSSDEEAGESKGRRKKGSIREKIKSVLPGRKKEENPTIVMS